MQKQRGEKGKKYSVEEKIITRCEKKEKEERRIEAEGEEDK